MLCEICNKDIDLNKIIRHHISYDPEIKINLCKMCHSEVHKLSGATRPREDYLQFYGNKGNILCRRRPKHCKDICQSCNKVRATTKGVFIPDIKIVQSILI